MSDRSGETVLLTAAETAERLNIPLHTFHKFRKQNLIPPPITGTRRWDWAEVQQAFQNRRRVKS